MNRGRKIYFGLLILSIVVVIIFCFSYAIFTYKTEARGKLNIVAGTLDYKLESDKLKNNQIEVDANSTIQFIIKITSLNTIDSKYELYYNLPEGVTDVEVWCNSSTAYNLKGIIKSKEEIDVKEVVININNQSDTRVIVTFGVHGGLSSLEFDSIAGIGKHLNPFLSKMNQGDYVAYVGNNGCQSDGVDLTGSEESESKNSCLGWNANQTTAYSDGINEYGYCNNSTYQYKVTGWRIAYIEDNRAYLISAGSPECFSTTAENGSSVYITIANNRANKYCNSNYVDGNCIDNSDSWAINNTDFNKITSQATGNGGGYLFTPVITNAIQCGVNTGSTCNAEQCSGVCGIGNDLIDNGGQYRFAAIYPLKNDQGVNWNPNISSIYSNSLTYNFGFRPIIRLSESVYVTGGSGTIDDPYTIGY